mmetsp:Transcript_24581/g.38149  ORF Transcript_24581/g.38149 Transcript_24581/m.38149 type:complete len:169 (+) Transcript_24581:78-584(+)
MFRIWPHRTYGVVILFLLACFLHYFFWHVDVAYTTTTKEQGETVATYNFPPIYAGQVIPHLTPINPSTLIPRGSYPIDAAHRNGYLHTGHCLFIMDESGLLLFLNHSLEEFSDWIEADARDHDKEEEEEHNLRHHGGKKDDGPPSGDFCHHTIRTLYAKGLENLKLMI